MAAYVVWMDQEHAKLFKLMPGGKIDEKHVKHHGANHHTSNAKDTLKEHGHYYHDVADQMKDASEILLVGPGMGKEHFKKYLETHHLKTLLSKVVGTESMDHPTEKQIIAHARKFFRAKDLFDGFTT